MLVEVELSGRGKLDAVLSTGEESDKLTSQQALPIWIPA